MIKQVPVSQLRPGMYLHKLSGTWMTHPFWRRSFLLKASDLPQIHEAGIEDAWIDTDRGIDVGEAVPSGPAEAPSTLPSSTIQQPEVDYIDMPTLPEPTQPMPLDGPEVEEIDLSRASELCTNAASVVRRLHDDLRLGRAFDSAECSQVVHEIVDHVRDDAASLLLVVRLKNHSSYAYMHSVATAALMVAMARQLNFNRDQMSEAGFAGLLHDVGKLFIPVEILEKPAALTTQEYQLVKTHTVRGHAALVQARVSSPIALDVCLHHHERMDGTGYPHGLSGDKISLFAKMAAICDVYDAITSDRPHRRQLDPSRALRQMATTSGQFDMVLFQSFVKTVGIYPVGMVVKLQSERLAIVMAQDEQSLLKPTVKVFYSVKDKHPVPAAVLRLASDACDDKIVDVDCSPEMQMLALAEM